MLGIPFDDLEFGAVVALTRGKPVYDLEGCTLPNPEGGEKVRINVDAAAWYVRLAGWDDRLPHPDRARGQQVADQEAVRRAAEVFVRQHFPTWSSRMTPEIDGALTAQWETATGYAFSWAERLRSFYTGARVWVEVTGYGTPDEVYWYMAHIPARQYKPTDVKVSRERAMELALAEGRKRSGPTVRALKADGYLCGILDHDSPRWTVMLAIPGQSYAFQVHVDAVTGAIIPEPEPPPRHAPPASPGAPG